MLHVQVLVIVAASHLDAVTFQICSQSFKIMPTAFFAVWLLGQYLTPLQWGLAARSGCRRRLCDHEWQHTGRCAIN